jgi:hypothetical protein
MKSDHDENNLTKDYMKVYGIQNVRGGSYATVKLSEEVEALLATRTSVTNDIYQAILHVIVKNTIL